MRLKHPAALTATLGLCLLLPALLVTGGCTPQPSPAPEASAVVDAPMATDSATTTPEMGPPPAPPGPPSAPPAANTEFDKTPFKGNGKPVTTKSGLKYEEMTLGKGTVATAGKTVGVHYTGTLVDGTKFDSSRDRGEPIVFPLGAGQVIPGWDEGIAGMKVGGRRKLTIPADLAYGASPPPGAPIPPNAVLVFDVELMSVQ